MQTIYLWAAVLGLLLSAGCDEAPPAPSSSMGTSSSTGAPPPPPSGATDIDGPKEIAEDPRETGDALAESTSKDDAADGFEREVVAVGADKRGRNYGGGVISEPIRQYFRAGQRINLLNLKRAMDLYKAANDNKLPATHEQFMKEIVVANSIELPQLPDGERYVYDPQRGELMVERPKP